MHAEALRFVAQQTTGHSYHRILEFGSRNINGTVRSILHAVDWYKGIDLEAGPDVDEVVDAVFFRLSSALPRADLLVCCEVLEHAPNVEGVIASMSANLDLDGQFIITCATDPRTPHSGADGGPLRDGEHYANVDPHELSGLLGQHDLLIEQIEVHDDRGDLYVSGVRT